MVCRNLLLASATCAGPSDGLGRDVGRRRLINRSQALKTAVDRITDIAIDNPFTFKPKPAKISTPGGEERVLTLQETHPNLAKEYFQFGNDTYLFNLTAADPYPAWWSCAHVCERCGQNHLWRAQVCDRTAEHEAATCPTCSGQDPCWVCSQSVAWQHPQLVFDWNWYNLPYPHHMPASGEKFHWGGSAQLDWTCEQSEDHGLYSATIAERLAGKGCPECAEEAARAKSGAPATEGDPEPARLPLLAEARPDLAAELHPTGNPFAVADPASVHISSYKRAIWVCSHSEESCECGGPRLFEATINMRVEMGAPKNSCPHCNISGRLPRSTRVLQCACQAAKLISREELSH